MNKEKELTKLIYSLINKVESLQSQVNILSLKVSSNVTNHDGDVEYVHRCMFGSKK